MEDTPTAVLIKVGHNEHKVTVIAEVKKDFSNQESGDVTYMELTTNVTMGNQAKGETGLNSCISGLSAVLNTGLMPHNNPSGTAIKLAITKPANTVYKLVKILSK
jgi:hypothetical protein